MSIVSVDNIQPIGSGTSVTVNNAATLVVGNLNSSGVVTATSFTGDGSGLTGVTATATGDNIIEGNTKAEVVDTGSDGHFKVETEGTERLRIDSSGYLIAKADIRLRRTASNNGAIYFGDTNNNYIFGTDADDVITFATAGSERLRITSGGLVGIGSITPANQLDIQGGSHTKIHVGTTGTGHATGIQINHAKGNSALQEWQLQTDATSTANLIIRNATSGNTIQTFNTTGNITTPLQCGACVRMSASSTSWPGNNSFESSNSLLAFDTEIYDIGGNYNTSTYAFTAPVAGRYLITYNVQLEDITNAGWWYVYPVVNANNSQTNARGITYADYGMGSSSSSYFATTGSYIPLLQANDSVTLRARGTISANIKGTFESSWSIMLIG